MTLRIGACDCDDVDAATYLVERRTVSECLVGEKMKNRHGSKLYT